VEVQTMYTYFYEQISCESTGIFWSKRGVGMPEARIGER
jgi:hypothetical protein